ncbi:hypothetical protein [Endozoicomonas sp.]|uniref:hypothetical protein n=1 Tax=Endozoicomonas sp. TaxID=1892382 RepID=UPI00383A0A14
MLGKFGTGLGGGGGVCFATLEAPVVLGSRLKSEINMVALEIIKQVNATGFFDSGLTASLYYPVPGHVVDWCHWYLYLHFFDWIDYRQG